MKLTDHAAYALFISALLAGCSSAQGAESDLAVSSSALVGKDTYLYFRSNATGWNADAATRLRSTADPYVFAMLYDVKQSWMIANGDNGVFTETNALDGWGNQQTTYGAARTSSISVPGGDFLSTGSGGFTVKYPAVGRYKVTANWMQGTFQVTPASPAESWNPCLNEPLTTLAQSPVSVNNVFAGCSNGDVYLTFNGLSATASWQKVDTWNTSAGRSELPNLPVNAIAYSPTDIKTVYIAFGGSKQGHKLWKTATGGATWIELASVPLAEIWSLSVNPLDSLKVYAFGPSGAYMSPDAGGTWTADVTPVPMTVPLAEGSKLSTVSVAAGNRDVVWVGATNGDIFFTNNATSGQTWLKATHDMPNRAVTHLALDTKRTPVGVFATFDGMYNDSLWVTSNNGFGWAMLHNPGLPTTNLPLPGIYGFYGVSLNPVDSAVLYINGTYGAGISTTGASVWSWTSSN